MRAITDGDLAWIRGGTAPGMTLASALPAGFAVYGVLDLDQGPDSSDQDHALLDAVAPDPDEILITGRIVRDLDSEREVGTEHVLYSGWRFRTAFAPARDVHDRIERSRLDSRDSWPFPDLLLPRDRSWMVSTLWDDAWRSIGVEEQGARAIERALPGFQRLDRGTDLRSTGRTLR